MPTPVYRALSLDLWFTTISYTPRQEAAWEEARESCLHGLLVREDGSPFPRERLRTEWADLRSTLRARGTSWDSVDPRTSLASLGQRMGARLALPLEEATREYSGAGLTRAPPSVNPQALRLARRLQEEGIPVISITNTSRRAESWDRFFQAAGGPSFHFLVTSSEVGCPKPSPVIFREAAHRLDMAPQEILHVGDRWDLDVMGARSSGMGRALYRGLWSTYSDPSELEMLRALDDGRPDVIRVDDLAELLERVTWSPPAPAGTRDPGSRFPHSH